MTKIVLPLPSLTTLLFDENPLLGEDVFELLLPHLNSTKLEVLSLTHCGLGHKAAQDLNQLTSGKKKYYLPKSLVKLDLRGNFLVSLFIPTLVPSTIVRVTLVVL